MDNILARKAMGTGIFNPSAAAPTYTISGTVYDADGSTAVSGATITLGELTATSAANGTYTISNVAAGASGSMTCTKVGYLWPAITVAAMSGNLTSQNYTNAWYAASGVAAKIAAVWQTKGAVSQAAAYLRIAGSLGNANIDPAIVGGTASAWDATNGFVLTAASSHYYKLGLLPGSGWSAVVRFADAASATGYVFGSFTNVPSVSRFAIRPQVLTDVKYERGDSTLNVAGAVTTGVLGIAGADPYRNGVDDGSLPAWGGIDPTNQEVYLGCLNQAGSPVQFFDGKILAIAFYFETLNATEMGAVMSSINF